MDRKARNQARAEGNTQRLRLDTFNVCAWLVKQNCNSFVLHKSSKQLHPWLKLRGDRLLSLLSQKSLVILPDLDRCIATEAARGHEFSVRMARDSNHFVTMPFARLFLVLPAWNLLYNLQAKSIGCEGKYLSCGKSKQLLVASHKIMTLMRF